MQAYCPAALKSTWARIEASEIGYRLARGTFWSIFGAVISRGFMLMASILVARMLGGTGYGELGMIQSTVGMLGVFAGFGLGLTATKHVAESYQSDPARAGRIIALSWLVALATGGLMALSLFLFAPWLARHTLNALHLTGALRIGALLLLLTALNGAQIGALSAFEAFKTIARVNLLVGMLSFPVLVGGAYVGGVNGAVWALTINMAGNWLLNHLALRKEAGRYEVPFTFQNCRRELSILWHFSLPVAFASALVGPINWMCSTLLVNQPGGYSQMGLFSAANQWRLAVLFVPSMVGRVVLPMLSNLNGREARTTYRRVLRVSIAINGGAGLTLMLPIALFASGIMRSYGRGFEDGRWVLVCLVLSAVLMAVNNVVGQAIVSKGCVWVGFLFNLCWASTLLVFSWSLLQRGYGAFGLALATLLAYTLHTLLQSAYLGHVLREKPGQDGGPGSPNGGQAVQMTGDRRGTRIPGWNHESGHPL